MLTSKISNGKMVTSTSVYRMNAIRNVIPHYQDEKTWFQKKYKPFYLSDWYAIGCGEIVLWKLNKYQKTGKSLNRFLRKFWIVLSRFFKSIGLQESKKSRYRSIVKGFDTVFPIRLTRREGCIISDIKAFRKVRHSLTF